VTDTGVRIVKPNDCKADKDLFDKVLENILPEAAKVVFGYDMFDIDKRIIVLICVFFYGLLVGLGLYIGYSQYMSIIGQKFISIDPSSGECYEVPRPLNSLYYADSLGFWSTNAGFKYRRSLYLAKANSLQMVTITSSFITIYYHILNLNLDAR